MESREENPQRSLEIRREQLMAVIRATLEGGGGGSAGRPDPDNPLPPGPWDPVIRIALERSGFGTAAGPSPEPWRLRLAALARRRPEVWDLLGGGGGPGGNPADRVALNPQPLPPRWAFVTALAQGLAERAGMLQEFAGAMSAGGGGEGEERGIIIVGGYVSRFVDDLCGNDFRFRWPFPGPRPNWLAEKVTGADLVVMAAEFDRAASESFAPELRRALGDASARLAETGLSRLG